MWQLFLNISVSSFIFLLVSISFVIIYQSVKFFDISHAARITLGAYFTFLFSQQLAFSYFLAIPLAILLVIITSISIEHYIYNTLHIRYNNSYILLIVSLGMYVILQNIISVVWGDASKSIRYSAIKEGYRFIGAYITDIQVITILISLGVLILMLIFYKITKLGRQMRAVSSNPVLSDVFGINTNRVKHWAYGLGSGLAAIAGILVAFDTDMRPTMGFNLLLYGVVVMIIGGVGSIWGLICGAFLLSTAQHFSAYYMDSKWMDAIAYIILILFLIWKPLGFSGKQLKKIEI